MTATKKPVARTKTKATAKKATTVAKKATPTKRKPAAKKQPAKRGRKPGAATKQTRAIADREATSGEQMPLEYMLERMRTTSEELKAQYEAGKLTTEEYMVKLNDLEERRDRMALAAAPYCHPRLAAIQANVTAGSHDAWIDFIAGKGEFE